MTESTATDDGAKALIAERVLGMIHAGPDAGPGDFDQLALDVFAYQYRNNAPYREFCELHGVAHDRLEAWPDIPAYPTDAFKHDIVASFPVEQAVLRNMTSGTTSPNQRGRIFRDEVGRDLIFSANRVMTGHYVFPDMESGRRCRILILAPSPKLAPTMGMAIGMERTRVHFGSEDSAFLVGRTGVDVRGLVRALSEAQTAGEPVALIGATSAFIYFLKACREKGLAFRLPPCSRVCDGGGYRGRFGEYTREDYYALVEDVLGVREPWCVNTLGLAESSTNYFDDSLRRAAAGGPPAKRRKIGPPWTRTQAFDPASRTVLPHGEVGLLRHYDLANLPTVIGVQTDNLGYTDEDGGFEIVGRAKIVDGRVAELPSEHTVGPMGDKTVFRLLEAYVNFSIDLKMSGLGQSGARASEMALRRESEAANGFDPREPTASCPIVVDELVAAADDPQAQHNADAALAAFQEEADAS